MLLIHSIMVHATDTDVVVIAVSVSSIFQNCEVWMAFGHDTSEFPLYKAFNSEAKGGRLSSFYFPLPQQNALVSFLNFDALHLSH